MNRVPFIFIALFVANITWGQSNYYYPSKGSVWENKSPTDFNMNPEIFDKAIGFAKNSSNKNTKDLRQDILKGFESEPYHEILGPTKKRGESAGIILNGDLPVCQESISQFDLH